MKATDTRTPMDLELDALMIKARRQAATPYDPSHPCPQCGRPTRALHGPYRECTEHTSR
jgi:hypothetical protein